MTVTVWIKSSMLSAARDAATIGCPHVVRMWTRADDADTDAVAVTMTIQEFQTLGANFTSADEEDQQVQVPFEIKATSWKWVPTGSINPFQNYISPRTAEPETRCECFGCASVPGDEEYDDEEYDDEEDDGRTYYESCDCDYCSGKH